MVNIEGILSRYESRDLREHRGAVRALHRAQQSKLGDVKPGFYSEIEVSATGAIPRLAWICKIQGLRYDFTVGSAVETREDFIFEGVWDGDFTKSLIDETDFAYGSGARFHKGGHVVFVPPKHCYEYLFVVDDSNQKSTYVSNSMNYVLKQSGMAGSKAINKLTKILRAKNDEATKLGIDRYDQLVYEDSRFKFYRMMFYNFTVDAGGHFQIYPTLPKRLFKGFEGYKTFLTQKIKELAVNGSHPARKISLPPITLMSSGYDSPCVGVLAASLGYKDAATIDITVKGREDSGEAIAKKLGMNVVAVRHTLGENVPVLSTEFKGDKAEEIAEFVATPGLGDDVMLVTLEKHLKDRIYLSGAGGDAVWRRPSRMLPGLPVKIPHGKSTTEFRLRVGYSFVPVPVMGARFVWPIKRMTHSKAMKEYTLYQRYDRPIPRRIVEEAGIERGTFASAKAATNPTVLNYDNLIVSSINKIVERYSYNSSERVSLYVRKNSLIWRKLGQIKTKLHKYKARVV